MAETYTQQQVTDSLPRRETERGQVFEVSVVAGPDTGATLRLADATEVYLIGTSEACALRLTDRAVSRRHLAARPLGWGVRFTDLQSTNGTLLSGNRILDAELREGVALHIGGTTLVLAAAAASPGAAPADPRPSKQSSFGRMLGASPVMRRLFGRLEALAHSREPLLLEGEPGTGKELLAEVLHEEGPRRDRPFTSCDGAASDVDATLFGSRKVASLLEQSEGGTLLIQHVCYLPQPTQARLVQWLRGQPVERTDGSTLPPCNVRLIASSRRDVDREVEAGRFELELGSLLQRARIELPPLRVRNSDIELLAKHFWRQLNVGDRVIPAPALRRFEHYGWPGNVRELQTTVLKLATDDGDAIDPAASFRQDAKEEGLGEIAERLLRADLPLVQARSILDEAFDVRYLTKILALHGGNVSRAAGASGLARRHFHRLKAKHGLGT